MKTTITHRGTTFDVYTDGSGFVGVVDVRGSRFAVNYTGEISIAPINASSYRRAPRWYAEHARKVAAEVAAMLPAEWHAANRAMYSEP